jgi:predicted transglutaminase-like cysteine proteinase
MGALMTGFARYIARGAAIARKHFALELSLVAAMVVALAAPAHAIDARRPGVGLLPVKAVVSAPQGAGNLCDAYQWACARSTHAVVIDKTALDVARQINSRINRAVRPVSDVQQYRVAERWSLPTKRGGDCEDYALAKKRELIAAGFSPQSLLIATVLDRKGGSHAVLVLRTGAQDLVLDNLTSTIKPWQKTGYTFLRLQNPDNPRQWMSVFAGGMFDKVS